MRLLLLLLIVLALPPAELSSIRLLLRDVQGRGVARATLTLRLADGQTRELTTDAQGVAAGEALPGRAVWLLRGELADGTVLIADSYPADAGFRLALIPGQMRDVLLRLDGQWLVLDPDMIFAPDADGGPAAPTPPALATPSPPHRIGAADGGAALAGRSAEMGWSVVWWVMGVGLALCAGALLLGLTRRRGR